MKEIVRRMVFVNLAVLVLAALAGAFFGGVQASLSALTGAFCFSLPVVLFSGLVARATAGDQGRFLGRFMAAEAMKWAVSASTLALAFLVGVFVPVVLLGGFLFSVLVQVFFPIFVPKASQS